MLRPLAILTAGLLCTDLAHAQSPLLRQGPFVPLPSSRPIGGGLLGSLGDLDGQSTGSDPLAIVVGGTTIAPLAMEASIPVPAGPGWYNLSLSMPQYGVPELTIVGIPDPAVAGTGDRPLLVVCHQFGVSHGDVVFNTDFLTEALSRGWYLMGPLSRSPVGDPTVNYGSVESQDFTRRGLDWVLENYPIDRERIYGVGFSMGGAHITAYAQRNMDPDAGMFAAIVNHTGSVDQTDTWVSQPDARPFLETIFGATPDLNPFAYRRVSSVQLDPMTGTLDPLGVHMGENLLHVPTQLWWATQDPLQFLVNQTMEVGDLLTSLPGAIVDVNPIAVTGHTWDLLPEQDICNWLDGRTLKVPLESSVIADRDGAWYHFDVAADAPEEFVRFDYSIDLSGGTLNITGTESLGVISSDLTDWDSGAPGFPLLVKLEAIDDPDTVILGGFSSAPLVVERDGVPNTTDWSFDWVTGELTITEFEVGVHSWSFQP